MSTDNPQKFRDAFVAFFAPDMASTATALADAMLNQEFRYDVTTPLESNVNAITTWTFDQSTGANMLVKTFKVMVGTNLTAVNANIATIALVYNNGSVLGADTVLCNVNTAFANGGGTDNIAAGTAYSFTLNAATTRVPAGSQLQLKITKTGNAGVALPNCTWEVKAAPVA